VSRFRFVDDHRDLYEVKRLCELALVSRSGCYAWRDRPASAREVADGYLVPVIVEVHERSCGSYGRPRITGQLRRRGFCVNHKRVGRLMRQADLAGLSNRKRTSPSSTPTRAASISPGCSTCSAVGSWAGP
jgi:hypothetical protein